MNKSPFSLVAQQQEHQQWNRAVDKLGDYLSAEGMTIQELESFTKWVQDMGFDMWRETQGDSEDYVKV